MLKLGTKVPKAGTRVASVTQTGLNSLYLDFDDRPKQRGS